MQSSFFLESFSKWGDDGQERGTCNTWVVKKHIHSKDHLRLSETPEKAPLEKIQFCFPRRYLLQITSSLGVEFCVHFPFSVL